jgi:hypothetical protein
MDILTSLSPGRRPLLVMINFLVSQHSTRLQNLTLGSTYILNHAPLDNSRSRSVC